MTALRPVTPDNPPLAALICTLSGVLMAALASLSEALFWPMTIGFYLAEVSGLVIGWSARKSVVSRVAVVGAAPLLN